MEKGIKKKRGRKRQESFLFPLSRKARGIRSTSYCMYSTSNSADLYAYRRPFRNPSAPRKREPEFSFVYFKSVWRTRVCITVNTEISELRRFWSPAMQLPNLNMHLAYIFKHFRYHILYKPFKSIPRTSRNWHRYMFMADLIKTRPLLSTPIGRENDFLSNQIVRNF